MLRFAIPLVISIFLNPPFLPVDSGLGSSPSSLLADSTYLAVMADFSEQGVPVNYLSNPALYLELHQWFGTPHRRRGQNGIDCSGLVKIIYRKVYGTELTGSSQDMARQTDPVHEEGLQEGDLVFFRIRHQNRIDHVGIYLGGDKFIHTSSSQGVKISDLKDSYFKLHFIKAGRIPSLGNSSPSMAKDQ